MKKYLIILLAVSIITLIGCNNGDIAGTDTDNKNEDQANQPAPKEESQPEVTEEVKLEVTKKTGGTWKDSIDNVWVHSSAVFKNTGTVPIEIGETQMNFKGTDGGVLGTASFIYSVPDIVLPGEIAYISETTILEGVVNAAEYAETTYNFGYDKTDKKPNILEVTNVKGMKGNEYTPYKVTGVVKNTTSEKQDDIRIAAGLYDDSGVLLGVLTGGVDIGLNTDSDAGFELSYPEIPGDVIDRITTVDVKAYAWTF